MPVTTTIVTPSSAEPVTLTEAKLHLREDGTEQDTRIESLISAAREYIEGQTGRYLMSQTIRQYFDDFPEIGCPIRLDVAPVQSVSSVNYLDEDGTSMVLATSDYRSDVTSDTTRIEEGYDSTWPVTRGVVNCVWVDVVAGYASASAVPRGLRQAILLLVGHWYENIEAVVIGTTPNEVPLAVQSLVGRWAIYSRN